MLVVLVHGIFNTARRFRVMQAALERGGHRCLVPSLRPNSGRLGLEYLACQLKEAIDRAGAQEVCLVGFSMGGLVARYYLQELGGHQTAKLFFAIATPHRGSYWACCLPMPGVRQMRPGSPFLRRLQDSAWRLQGTACYAYWTPYDLTIVPAAHCRWEQAVNVRFDVLLHHLLIKDRRVIADMQEKMAAFAEARRRG